MKIDPTDLYHQEVYSILKELKHDYDINGSRQLHYSIRLIPMPRKDEISNITKQLIFNNFEKDKILKIVETYPSYVGKVEKPDAAFHTIELELQEPAFTDYLKEYKTAFNLSKKDILIIQKSGTSTLLINGEEFKAKFRVGSDYFKVLMLLAIKRGEIATYTEIGKVIKEKPEKNTTDDRRARDAIGYIKVKFGYKGDDFIETDYGFRLVCGVEIKG